VFASDVGSVLTPRGRPAPYDPHSPFTYVTRAQASDVFVVGADQWVWLGNQWTTGGGRANDSLLYWSVLEFDDGAVKSEANRVRHESGAAAAVQHFVHRTNVTIIL
jgi:hypothetical protein